MESSELVKKAIEARENSYSPYSHFAVGAAVLTKDGRVYKGTNIENSSYPVSICAERSALYAAYGDGVKKEEIAALAVAADTKGPCSPCGACRQVISELLPPDAEVYLANLKGEVMRFSPEELLPMAFDGSDL